MLEVEGLVRRYRSTSAGGRRDLVHAVEGVSFTVNEGETLALVGESGSGKSTIARCVTRLERPDAGTIRVFGDEVQGWKRRQLRDLRRRVQIVFQDPLASLDPRLTVRAALTEPFVVQKRRREAKDRVPVLAELVHLERGLLDRYPHELSGGQRQRVGIARALALDPKLVVLDEPVTALDASVQAQVLALLAELQERLGLTYVFVSHDLAVVRQVAHRVAVLHLGRIVEEATVDELFAGPAHPYTQALLSAVPEPDPERERSRQRIVLQGDPPSPVHPPSGCTFRTRCQWAQDMCAQELPELVERGQGHPVACHFAESRAVL